VSGWVVDASAMFCWCFEDERPRNADAIMQRLTSEGMHAPAHWSLELTNILWSSQRRGRITASDADAFIALVAALQIQIDPETSRRAWAETRALSQAENLTAYDAAYLELAIRRQAGLASKDASLVAAAKRRKLPLISL